MFLVVLVFENIVVFFFVFIVLDFFLEDIGSGFYWKVFFIGLLFLLVKFIDKVFLFFCFLKCIIFVMGMVSLSCFFFIGFMEGSFLKF